MIGPELAEMIMAAIGPMQLVEINMVGVEPLEREVDSCLDLLPVDRPAAADIGAARAGDLGGHNDLVAISARLHPAADEPLGVALRFVGHRCSGIEFRRVEEVHTLSESV